MPELTINRYWAGRISGTNTGNVFFEFSGSDDHLFVDARINDTDHGVAKGQLTGNFSGSTISLSGDGAAESGERGHATVVCNLESDGSLFGTWEFGAGNRGTIRLFPHGASAPAAGADEEPVEQLYTKRATLGAIEITKDDLVQIAEEFEREFSGSQAVITIHSSSGGAGQVLLLRPFREKEFRSDLADFGKIHIQRPERSGINRILSLELGKFENFIVAQSTDESWAIGRTARLEARLRPFRRTYATNFSMFGVGFAQIIVLAMIVYLPSLENLSSRAVYAALIFLIVGAFLWLHGRLVYSESSGSRN